MWCGRRMLQIPWASRVNNGEVLMKINENYQVIKIMEDKRNRLRHSDWWTKLTEGTMEAKMKERIPRREFMTDIKYDGVQQ